MPLSSAPDPASQHPSSGFSGVDASQQNYHQSQTDSIQGPPNPVSQAVVESDSASRSPSVSQRLMTPSLLINSPPIAESFPFAGRSSSPPFPSFSSLASPSPSTRIPFIPPSPEFSAQVRPETDGGPPAESDREGTTHLTAVGGSWSAGNCEPIAGAERPREDSNQPIHPSTEAPPPQHPVSAMSVDNTHDHLPENEPDTAMSAGPLTKEGTQAVASHDRGDGKREEQQSPSQEQTNQAWTMQLQTQCPIPSPVSTPTQTQFPLAQTRPALRQTWYQASHLRRVSGSFTKGGSGAPRASPLQRRQT